MALPDISGLTEAELQQLQVEASARLYAMQHTEDTNRELLLDGSAVAAQITALLAVVDDMAQIAAAANADVNAAPAPYIKACARGVRRCARNTARLLRIVSGQLDSATIGEDEPTP